MRIEVPVELHAKIGLKHLTEGLGTRDERKANRLAPPVIAKFQAQLDRARGLDELAALGDLTWPPRNAAEAMALKRFPEVWARFLGTLDLPVPANEKPHQPVTFEWVIEKWRLTKGDRAKDEMRRLCGTFIDCLGQDDLCCVSFAAARDWRDEMIREEELASGTISNRPQVVKTLFKYAFDNEYITSNSLSWITYQRTAGEERDDFSAEERRHILTLAPQAEPHIYWLN